MNSRKLIIQLKRWNGGASNSDWYWIEKIRKQNIIKTIRWIDYFHRFNCEKQSIFSYFSLLPGVEVSFDSKKSDECDAHLELLLSPTFLHDTKIVHHNRNINRIMLTYQSIEYIFWNKSYSRLYGVHNYLHTSKDAIDREELFKNLSDWVAWKDLNYILPLRILHNYLEAKKSINGRWKQWFLLFFHPFSRF